MYFIKNLNLRAAFIAGSAGLFQLDCTHIDKTPKKVFHLPIVVPECLPNYPKGFTNKNVSLARSLQYYIKSLFVI